MANPSFPLKSTLYLVSSPWLLALRPFCFLHLKHRVWIDYIPFWFLPSAVLFFITFCRLNVWSPRRAIGNGCSNSLVWPTGPRFNALMYHHLIQRFVSSVAELHHLWILCFRLPYYLHHQCIFGALASLSRYDQPAPSLMYLFLLICSSKLQSPIFFSLKLRSTDHGW